MKYFSKEFIDFFNDLSKNNHKEWFHQNKKRYESSVKKPFEVFLTDLIESIQKEDPSVQVDPKDCVLRINRDIRFAKDKTPYNLHYSAVVSSAGRKDKSVPGIFLRFTPEEIGIMGGAYVLDKDQLLMIRKYLAKHYDEFRELLENHEFKKKFNDLKGDEAKRVPPEIKDKVARMPLLMRKQFYFVAKRDTSLILSEDLLTEIMDYWHAARPLNQFLSQSIH